MLFLVLLCFRSVKVFCTCHVLGNFVLLIARKLSKTEIQSVPCQSGARDPPGTAGTGKTWAPGTEFAWL